jgi:SAM-dependent methyltransferase
LAQSLRALQHWNQWLSQHFLGQHLLKTEGQLLGQLLDRHYGKHVALIGVPNQYELLKVTHVPVHTLVSPLTPHGPLCGFIEGEFQELPLLTGSMDLVILPHSLEFIDNPRQLLSEACRIIKPEGLIVICGFNPYSLWGLKRFFKKHPSNHWHGNSIRPTLVKNWLDLADFAMEKHLSALFAPPVYHQKLYDKLQFLEKVGNICFPQMGGIYIIISRAKVIPLTPIRLKWKQHLSGIRVSTTIPGHIARQSKR